jgi:glutamate-1-semialdehyde 2,1-aminomutase
MPSTSADLLDRAAEVIPGGVNTCRRRSEPRICFRRGAGAHLFDLDGRRYIDYHAAYGAILLGHSHPAVTKRETVLFGVGVTEAEVALAEAIVRHVPSAEQVVVCNSGSEATYHAIRLARAVTGREKIVKFQGSYNGFHDYVLRNVLSTREQVGRRDPHSKGMLSAAIDATLVCRYNDLADVESALTGAPVAAVILEPIGHNAPGILPEPGFLEGLRELCDAAGALLVFDEVITGFRVARGGAQERFGVEPDLTVLGKIVGAGLPLAAFGGRGELMERLAPAGNVYQAGTLSGNPLATAAGLSVLRRLRDRSVYEELERRGTQLERGLRETSDGKATVQRVGAMLTLFLSEEPVANFDDASRCDTERYGALFRHLLERGIYVAPSQFEAMFPSLAHGDEEIDRTVEAVADFFA